MKKLKDILYILVLFSGIRQITTAQSTTKLWFDKLATCFEGTKKVDLDGNHN